MALITTTTTSSMEKTTTVHSTQPSVKPVAYCPPGQTCRVSCMIIEKIIKSDIFHIITRINFPFHTSPYLLSNPLYPSILLYNLYLPLA